MAYYETDKFKSLREPEKTIPKDQLTSYARIALLSRSVSQLAVEVNACEQSLVNEWFASKEGRDASNGATLSMPSIAQPYFRHRLELAFLAGAKAQRDIDEREDGER